MAESRLVLHVINSLQISGGAEQQLVANLQRFRDSRIRHAIAHLYSYEAETRRDEISTGVDASPASAVGTRHGELPASVTVYPLRRVGERGGQLDSLRRLSRLVAELKPDLIHCYLAEAAVAARVVGAVRGIPVIESLVNISHEPVRCVDNAHVTPWKLRAHALLDRLTMSGVRHFQALSPAVSESWQRVVGLRPERISVIPRGIDVQQIDRSARAGLDRAGLLEELGLPGSAYLLVCVGRHESQKGHRYAIEAMPRILAEVPESVLLIVGRPGNRTRALEAKVAELGLGDRVRFLGSRRDVASIVAAADLFVFPSLFEGLGVSLLEAMALGATCLVSDTPPMNRTVRHGETGLLFDMASPPSLASSVLVARRDPGLCRRLGEAARREIETNYRLEDTARRVEEMYLREFGLPRVQPLDPSEPGSRLRAVGSPG